MHPFLLHTTSINETRNQRVITNPPTYLSAQMNFHRENPADQTIVERAILRGLGVESYDFQATAPRERIVPQRVIAQRKLEAEKAALAA